MPHYGFRPLAGRDMKLLARWLAEPHVAAWWGDAESELKSIADHIDSISVEPFVIEMDGRPIGYIQSYDPHLEEGENPFADQPFGTLENGFGGLGTEFTFNGEVQARHWGNLKKWADEGLFQYAGPVGGPDSGPKFYAQECAIFMNSSAGRAGVLNNSKDFEVGFAPLPYYDDVIAEPKNSIIGGATLWTLNGKDPEVYKGVAQFFTYLSSPEVQASWHQATGYLPITNATYELGQEQGYYEANPGSDVAIKQIMRGTPTANSKGVRFGNFTQVRTIVDEEFQALLAGKKDAKQALDSAVTRGNQLLREFESANTN